MNRSRIAKSGMYLVYLCVSPCVWWVPWFSVLSALWSLEC